MHTWELSAAFVALILASGHATGQVAITSLGDLVCSVGSATKNDSAIATVGDGHNVVCVFAPAEDGPQETYTGTLRTSGVNEDLTGKPVVIFAVRGARDAKARIGVLGQTFVGRVVDSDGAKSPLAGDADSSVMLSLIGRDDAAHPGKPTIASVELRLWSTTG